MSTPILDELEKWIARARAIPEVDMRPVTAKEMADDQARYGPHNMVLGPFLISWVDGPGGGK